jgi:deazaflavin-dependent oxidoreductase (nitroreductase family)
MSLYERALEAFGRSRAGTWYLKRVAPKIDPPLLRLTGGRVSSVYPVPVMLLTTTGAKSGLPRTLPLLYVVDDDGLLLIASNYGSTRHPAWYRNLVANPEVDVLAGRHSGRYTAAEITDPDQRDRAWAEALDTYAGYSDYEVRAGNRTIPLIRLTRVTA